MQRTYLPQRERREESRRGQPYYPLGQGFAGYDKTGRFSGTGRAA